MTNPEMSQDHRRAVGVALSSLDEMLCAIESWTDGQEDRGVLYFETNDLPRHRRKVIRSRTAEMRTLLAEARVRLDLKTVEVRASDDVWVRCCGIRDTLSELGAQYMKEYGEMSPGLSQYMDGLSARLVAAIDRLAREARPSR